MASVVGIDFGNLASKVSLAPGREIAILTKALNALSFHLLKIGVARQRGIDVITNEVSNRATPYVSAPIASLGRR